MTGPAMPPVFDPRTPPTVPDWPRLRALYRDLLVSRLPLGGAVARLRGSLVYLASPYSLHVRGEDGAFDSGASAAMSARAAFWARLLAAEGVTAVSPVVLSAEMVHADRGALLDPLDAAFWDGWCHPLLRACEAVVIPPIAGWDLSLGVWREACAAIARNRRVYIVEEDRCLTD